MLILAIDTSCDETSVAVSWNDVILSNVLSSQVELHKKYGGVVPFLAQRMHQEKIGFVIHEALKRANSQITKSQKSQKHRNIENLSLDDIDIFAVTYGPGLAPALQVGIEKAKELAKKYKKPLVAVNHMEGHIYSNFAKRVGVVTNDKKEMTNNFPLLCLLISGGHTELVLMRKHGKYEIIGETLDDAVGEAFDKVGRMLSLGYPAGPSVEQLAKEGDSFAYPFPIPLKNLKDCNFSYSGLKTSVLYTLQKISPKGRFTKRQICDVCASFQRAAVEHLVQKTTHAVNELRITNYELRFLLLGGGVVANRLVRKELRKAMRPFGIRVIYPTDKKLIGDNAAMIAVAAYYKAKRKEFVKNIAKLERIPGLRIAK